MVKDAKISFMVGFSQKIFEFKVSKYTIKGNLNKIYGRCVTVEVTIFFHLTLNVSAWSFLKATRNLTEPSFIVR